MFGGLLNRMGMRSQVAAMRPVVPGVTSGQVRPESLAGTAMASSQNVAHLPPRPSLSSAPMAHAGLSRVSGQDESVARFEKESDLPLNYTVLTHVKTGKIALPPDRITETCLIGFHFPPVKVGGGQTAPTTRVYRLTAPSWGQSNEHVNTVLAMNGMIAKLKLPSPIQKEATRELICRLNGVDGSHEAVEKEARVRETLSERQQQQKEREAERNPYHQVFMEILTKAVNLNTQDIHITVSYDEVKTSTGALQNASSIEFRIDGEITPMPDLPKCKDPTFLRQMLGYFYNNLADGQSTKQWSPDQFQSMKMKDRKIGLEVIRGRYQDIALDGRLSPDQSKPFITVMRVIYVGKEGAPIPTLKALGFLPDQEKILVRCINSKKGLICVSGKVGSGKSTSLRSVWDLLPRTWRKFSAEDPVENSHNFNRAIDLSGGDETIDKVLASLKRGDLDALLMGEVRTKKTMDLVRNVVFSGHPCLTTTHSGSALGQLPYFLTPELGMDNYQLSNADFLGVLFHQCLVRKLCTCSHDVPRDAVVAKIGKERLNKLETVYKVPTDKLRIRNDKGCDICIKKSKGIAARVGYIGMDVLAEFFVPDADSRELIERNRLVDLEAYWRGTHSDFNEETTTGKTLQEVGLIKAIRGQIDLMSIEEKMLGFLDINPYTPRKESYGVR